MKTASIPKEFIWRRLHSLMGLWLVLFLMEHLFVNSQAALLLGENGKGFVDAVNTIHNLPFLPAIELTLLGVPILLHLVLGVKYLFTSKMNSFKSDGSKPSLPELKRNKAYSWQRITSWILLVTLVAHVVKFRFLEYPEKVGSDYAVTLHVDERLYPLAEKLGVSISNADNPHKLIALCPSFGTASLLSVRDTFQSPWYVAMYTLFVLAACFHGFNGLWTFMITWGVIFKVAAQRSMVTICYVLMALITLLGLASIWGTYLS